MLEVTGDVTPEELKYAIYLATGDCEPQDQKLVINKRAATHANKTLADLGVHEGGVVHCIISKPKPISSYL